MAALVTGVPAVHDRRSSTRSRRTRTSGRSPPRSKITTVALSGYAAIVISLPVLLYEAYAYLLPALTDRESRVIVPFLVAVPVLFCAGAVFGYFVVLPAAIKFLLNFNQSQ